MKILPLAKIEIGPPIQNPPLQQVRMKVLPKAMFRFSSIFLEGRRHFVSSICFSMQPSLGVFSLFMAQVRSETGTG